MGQWPHHAAAVQRHAHLASEAPRALPALRLHWCERAERAGSGRARLVVYTKICLSTRHIPVLLTHAVRYKLYGGELYRYRQCAAAHCYDDKPIMYQGVQEQIILAAHYHNLGDVDFIVHFGDGAGRKHPMLNWNLDVRARDAGFTMPYLGNWWSTRSVKQILMFHECLARRWPRAQRTRKAVWRGSTTDPVFAPVHLETLLNVQRVRLHLLSMFHSNVLDTRLMAISQGAPGTTGPAAKLLQINTTKWPSEKFQSFSALVDIDGNGWSSRFFHSVQQATPIIKQASPYHAFYEHLFAPGVNIFQTAEDLHDLPEVAAHVLSRPDAEILTMVQQTAGVAAVALNRWALIETTAAAIDVYKRLADWRVEAPGAEYDLVPRSVCCRWGNFPSEVKDAVKSAS